MPFVVQKDLEDELNPDAIDRFIRRTTDAAGDRLKANIRRRTPVGKAELGDRRPRRPGTLRDSIDRTPIEPARTALGSGWRVTVRTEDPIAPLVEWNTRPHIIRPRADRAPATVVETRKARGTVGDGRAALSWMSGGRRFFAKVVHHPGTQGHHMFNLGALETEGQVDEIAADPLRVFEHELTNWDLPRAL